MNLNNLKIGCDPELFISEGPRVVSFHNKLNGLVKTPVRFSNGEILEDGCSLEFNLPPATNEIEFSQSIQTMLDSIKEKWQITSLSSYLFEEKDIDSPLCWESGCNPSINALTGRRLPATKYCDGLRAAGGHLHIGFDNPTRVLRQRVGIMCDYLLGIPSLFLDSQGATRRSMYGQAGDIRFKPYGVEYRVLSNFWIFRQEHRVWAYRQAALAAKVALDDELFIKITDEVSPEEVQSTINGNNVQHSFDLEARLRRVLQESKSWV